MQVLKKGSKGEDVKILQVKLGLKPVDGVFGSGTEAAVKAFQKSKGLSADGIVGAGTWAALGVSDSESKVVDPSVVYAPLKVHVTKCANRSVRYIAIHYTAGGSSKAGRALAVKSVFEKRQSSADFAVDDASMVQFNPDIRNYYCWAVGDKKNAYSSGGSLNGVALNRNTVSIEICSNLKSGTSAKAANHSGWYFTDAALENARKLVRILMKRYDVPLARVIRHYDVTGKLCPGIVGWNNESVYDSVTGKRTGLKSNSDEWLKFKNSL